MKKVLSRLLSMSLAVMVAFGLMIVPSAVPVHADGIVCGSVKYAKNLKLFSIEKDVNVYELKMGKRFKNAKSVKVKSSKKSVLETFGYEKGDNYLFVNARKPGKATLTITVKKKSGKTIKYKANITVEKGSVPFKSVKVGSKDITSKYKNAQYADVKAKNNSKQKISVKPKSGKTIKAIEYSVWNEAKEKYITKNIKNNSTVKVKRYNTNIYFKVYDKKSKITFAYYIFL